MTSAASARRRRRSARRSSALMGGSGSMTGDLVVPVFMGVKRGRGVRDGTRSGTSPLDLERPV